MLFWTKVDRTRGCWLWTGGRDGSGYGRFSADGRSVAAHRFAYEQSGKPIPKGWVVHHRCERTPCVRPDHLEALPKGAHRNAHSTSGRENIYILNERELQLVVESLAPSAHDSAYDPTWLSQRRHLRERLIKAKDGGSA